MRFRAQAILQNSVGISSADSSTNTTPSEFANPTGGGLGRSCTTEQALFSEGPLAINTERSVPLDADGLFLYITPRPYAAPGSPDQRLPQRVIALDDTGATVATQGVPEVKATKCPTP